MLSRARIVLGERLDGSIETVHADFNAVAAVAAFNGARKNAGLTEIVMIEHGHITRVAKPSLEHATRKAAEGPKESAETKEAEAPKAEAKSKKK